ncbi:MAG TPA: hypothetical protein VNB49_04175 [Candidatus Dormibacteraeota bacterium]|nr:hypothetical protein [Candidatus Dormibacteraeota bacterium]
MPDPTLENLTPEQRAKLSFADLLLKNPDVALEAKKLAKKVNPELRFPDVEQQEAIAAATADLRKKQEEMEATINKDRIERAQEAKRAELRQQGVDVAALESFMKENELYSYDKAVKIFGQVNRVAPPTPTNILQDAQKADFKEWWKDPVKAARAEAEKFFEERGIARRA